MNHILSDLACRVTLLYADDERPSQLGGGRETDSATNPPELQTNPALFAAPHIFKVAARS
jgi:hypothetical protein